MKYIIATAMFVALCTVTLAQRNSSISNDNIRLGIDLNLGMSREFVISSLSHYFRMQKIDDDSTRIGHSSWLAEDKTTPSELYGAVNFDGDKLSSVTRYWQSSGDTDFSLASALFRATVNFKEEKRTVCLLDAGAKENPGGTVKTIFLICGAKSLQIHIVDYDNGGKSYKSAEVSETLGN